MVNVKIWHAKEAVIKLKAGTAMWGAGTSAYSTYFSAGTSVEGVMKDITVAEPIGDVDKIDLLGVTSGYQNAEIELKPAKLAEVSGTMVLPGDEVSEAILYGTGTSTGGYTVYRSGTATPARSSILLQLTDGADEVSYVLDGGYLTAHETKVTGADGHFECSMTLKGLPRDFYGPQFKD